MFILMATETEKRIQKDIEESMELLAMQKMTVNDGYKLIDTMQNFLLRYEEIRKSRDEWKRRFMEKKNGR